MKKLIACLALLAASSSPTWAVSPGGPNCGWGNMLFEGDDGLVKHWFAGSTNGTSGNATFGMTSGTNGCAVNGKLTYGGSDMVSLIMDELSEDIAHGGGDALNAVAVVLGVEMSDRALFAEVAHQNFQVIYPNESVTAEDVVASLYTVMKANPRLAKYAV